jgi:membrane-bound ClpP family serine protease
MANITWFSLLLLFIGIILVIIELYIPGIGIPGIIGAVSLIAFIFVTGQNTAQRFILAGIILLLCIILFVIFFTLLSKKRLPKSLILQDSEEGFTGTEAEDLQYLLGKTGSVLSTCRPAGNADFSGMKLDVVSRGEFIEKGATIEVIEIEGNRIVVKEIV